MKYGFNQKRTIPGYRIYLQPAEVLGCMQQCGYVHFIADERYAPLDARLFIVRQRLGTQASIPLVIASLLAKKLVVGLKEMGLDIRVGHDNNFGSSFYQARLNARRFCSVARILGIKATCILTDGSRPYQPMIGRGEALVALSQLFEETAGPWLQKHAIHCWNMATELAGYDGQPLPSGAKIETIFSSNLDAQGSSLEKYHARVSEVLGQPRFILPAKSSGWLLFRLGIMRSILVEIQRTYQQQEGDFPDPVGVQLLVNTGDYVEENRELIVVRAPEALHKAIEHDISATVEIANQPIPALKEEPWEVISIGW